MLSSFQKTKSTQSSGPIFADRIDQFKKTEFELELIKIVDCFLDGHSKYTSNLGSSKVKILYTNLFLISKKTCINQLVLQMISSPQPFRNQWSL